MELNELLVIGGQAVKDLGEGRVGGYLVLFSDAQNPDLAGDYFTKSTDFDLERSTVSSVYYAHGLDKTLGRNKLAEGSMKVDDVGVWIETQLDLRNAYQSAIYAMAKSKKLGWSSGSASHLVERKPVKGAQEITKWPLGLDASLTPSPAEPRTAVVELKSLEIQPWEEMTKDLVIDAPVNDQHQLSIKLQNTDFVEQPTCTLKDHFDICLLNVRVLSNRLNSLKELRANQGRKSPLSADNLERLEELHTAIKHLIEQTTYAKTLSDAEQRQRDDKVQLIDQVYTEAQSLTDWLETLQEE